MKGLRPQNTNENTHCLDPLCYNDVAGRDYNGTVGKTISGKTCQRWDVHTPHKHHIFWTTNHKDHFPDMTVSDASNYCRNPGGAFIQPWCLTTDPGTVFELCDVCLGEYFELHISRTTSDP